MKNLGEIIRRTFWLGGIQNSREAEGRGHKDQFLGEATSDAYEEADWLT